MALHSQKRKVELRPVEDQTIVITGATSGIGLATARKAAARGARIVAAARNEQALQELVDELKARGHQAVGVTADVSKEDDVRRIASTASERFGGFDTWINNAAVSMYGRLADVPIEDERQLFETNYWGVVNGSRVAVEHLKERGGAIINIGSANSDYAAPLQGTFSASKHAVKGYTDALRIEMEEAGAPVSVTLVKPSPTDTPYAQHARNHLEKDPQLTPPVYSPEVVADTILYCAEYRKRDVYAGGGGRLYALAGMIAPNLADKLMSRLSTRLQKRDSHHRNAHSDNLYSAGRDGQERGDYEGHVMNSSAYSKATLNPKRTGALILASGVIAGLLWQANRRNGKLMRRNRLGSLADRVSDSLPDRIHDQVTGGNSVSKEVRKLARTGRKAARSVPHMAHGVRKSIERNLPRH